MKTIVFIVIAVGLGICVLQYSVKRQADLKEQAHLCEQKCQAQGGLGSEFKASGFGDGECHCL